MNRFFTMAVFCFGVHLLIAIPEWDAFADPSNEKNPYIMRLRTRVEKNRAAAGRSKLEQAPSTVQLSSQSLEHKYDKEVLLNFLGPNSRFETYITQYLNNRRLKAKESEVVLLNADSPQAAWERLNEPGPKIIRLDIRSKEDLNKLEKKIETIKSINLNLTSHSKVMILGHGLPGVNLIEDDRGTISYSTSEISGLIGKNYNQKGADRDGRKIRVTSNSCSGGLNGIPHLGETDGENESFALRLHRDLWDRNISSSVTGKTGIVVADSRNGETTLHPPEKSYVSKESRNTLYHAKATRRKENDPTVHVTFETKDINGTPTVIETYGKKGKTPYFEGDKAVEVHQKFKDAQTPYKVGVLYIINGKPGIFIPSRKIRGGEDLSPHQFKFLGEEILYSDLTPTIEQYPLNGNEKVYGPLKESKKFEGLVGLIQKREVVLGTRNFLGGPDRGLIEAHKRLRNEIKEAFAEFKKAEISATVKAAKPVEEPLLDEGKTGEQRYVEKTSAKTTNENEAAISVLERANRLFRMWKERFARNRRAYERDKILGDKEFFGDLLPAKGFPSKVDRAN